MGVRCSDDPSRTEAHNLPFLVWLNVGQSSSLAIVQQTSIQPEGTGGYLSLPFLIAMVAAGSSPASTPSPSLQNGNVSTYNCLALNTQVVSHYSWCRSHFLEWLSTPHMARPRLPSPFSFLKFLRSSHSNLHLVPWAFFCSFPSLGVYWWYSYRLSHPTPLWPPSSTSLWPVLQIPAPGSSQTSRT